MTTSGADIFKPVLGKTITKLYLHDNALHIVFSDGTRMMVFDDGQQCCETRYMRTDDNLNDFANSKLISVDISASVSHNEEYSIVHEIQFMRIHTSKGIITFSNHNENNSGYYCGFEIAAIFNNKEVA